MAVAVEMDLLAEIADLKARVERLEQAAAPPQPTEDAEAESALEAFYRKYEPNRDNLGPALEAFRKRFGIPDTPPTRTPQEIQEQMIREGVRPEDRIGNTILEEMRGYRK